MTTAGDASILDAICDDESLFRASLRVLARTDEQAARALAERFVERALARAFADSESAATADRTNSRRSRRNEP